MSEDSIEFSLSNSEQRDSWLNSGHRTLDADSWETSVMFSCHLKNRVGGSIGAQYNKQYLERWSLTPLLRAEYALTTYLRDRHSFATTHIEDVKKLTLDMIIPCCSFCSICQPAESLRS